MEGFEIDGGATVNVYPSQHSIEDILQSKVEATDRNDQEDPFFVVNLGRLAALYNQVRFAFNCKPRGLKEQVFGRLWPRKYTA